MLKKRPKRLFLTFLGKTGNKSAEKSEKTPLSVVNRGVLDLLYLKILEKWTIIGVKWEKT